MNEGPNRQAILNQEHLKLLSLCYMVSAALSAFYSLIGLMYVGFGILMFEVISKTPNHGRAADGPAPALFGWIFGGFGLAIFLALATIAALKLRTAFCIKNLKSRTFCLVVALISCLEIPYGTLLGVFTFIVLDRDSVKKEFAKPPSQ